MARMASGDELKLSLNPAGERAYGKAWEGLGQVLRISDCEVSLMMHAGNVPLEITDGYQVGTLAMRALRFISRVVTTVRRVCVHAGSLAVILARCFPKVCSLFGTTFGGWVSLWGA